ncbi:methyltransferase family protein [Microbaculum sp. FT89]|uniref:methyltransferase family protein n=1 Tax=Microbaculum sp. FT89 TaxID=3447298 RepID=UPI003F535695
MTNDQTTAAVTPSAWLQDVQRRRKWTLLVLLVAAIGGLLVTESTWPSGSFAHEAIEYFGIGLLLLCVLGRAWCTIYIGGRKKAELVQEGPYSVSRNPLYVFSFIGAAGVGAAAGSVVTTLLAALACYAVFAVVVGKEEQFLADRFGATYDAYRARVPRFWPRFSAWKDVDTVETNPRLVLTSFGDGLFFFLAIPLVESIEFLHETGYLPVLFQLP